MGGKSTLLLVADSSPLEIDSANIEQRESGRGLAIVRDLVREWRGHLVIRRQEPPLVKGVGACFPG